jgi:hypothetical protein
MTITRLLDTITLKLSDMLGTQAKRAALVAPPNGQNEFMQ